mgnify:CR=1 FL=1
MNGKRQLLGNDCFASEKGDSAGEREELGGAHACDVSPRRGINSPHPQVMNTVTGQAQAECISWAGLPFTIFMAGAGIKKGMSYGSTDDYCYNITENPVHVHDLNATIMHLMGVDHKKLTYPFQGRDFRLTDIHGHLIKDILS